MWLRHCRYAMVWEHEVPAAGSPGLFTGSGTCGTSCGTSCGTTSARSLARVEDQGARTPWFAKRGSTHFAKRSYADTKQIRGSRGRGANAANRRMNSEPVLSAPALARDLRLAISAEAG